MAKWYSEQRVIKAVIFIGIALSLIQFLYNRSLWLDEASLARNIINKSGLELLQPLDGHQVAPVLFLELVKVFSILIPNTEYGLRLFPLLCFWLSSYVFYKIVCLIFNKPSTILVSLSLFALNYTLIYYASEVKQYMCDVLVLTSLYYITLRNYNKEKDKYYLLGMVGAVSVLLSNIAPLVFLSVCVYLLYNCRRDQRACFKYIAGMSFVWAVTFLLSYYYYIHGHPARDYMVAYWSKANGFMPQNPFDPDLYRFLVDKFTMMIGVFLPFSIGTYLLGVLCIIGSIALIVQGRWGLLLLLSVPILLHLSLSALAMYPFDARLLLYACPIVIITTSFGVDYLTERIAKGVRRETWQRFALLFALAACLLFGSRALEGKFPQRREEVKSSIGYIRTNMSKGDKVYVYRDASAVFKYYSDIQFADIHGPIIYGIYRMRNEEFLSELRALTGRNWLLFAHDTGNDEGRILGQLDSLGYSKVTSFKTKGSSAYLYDFMGERPDGIGLP